MMNRAHVSLQIGFSWWRRRLPFCLHRLHATPPIRRRSVVDTSEDAVGRSGYPRHLAERQHRGNPVRACRRSWRTGHADRG